MGTLSTHEIICIAGAARLPCYGKKPVWKDSKRVDVGCRGEYKSDEFIRILKNSGIKVLQSAPHTPQQNGHTERFNRSIMEKAEAMRHDACLPDSYWEFAVEHAVHCYNWTPVMRLKWCTPFEAIGLLKVVLIRYLLLTY